MVPAADAIQIDTTPLPLDQLITLMEQKVRQCLGR